MASYDILDLQSKSAAEIRQFATSMGIKAHYMLNGKLAYHSKEKLINMILNKQGEQSMLDVKPDVKPNVGVEMEVKEDNSLEGLIAKRVASMITVSASIDKEAIKQELSETVKEEIAKAFKPQLFSVKLPDGKVKECGAQHKNFPTLVKLLSSRENVMLVGAAGSGKTSAVEKASEAIELPFYTISVGAQTTKTDLLGYKDAQGVYQESLLCKAYKDGGVFLLDEFDAGNANVMTILNAATSNGYCAFPCGMVKKHENFVCVASGNTYGLGADRQYVGRNQLDAASLDRFTVINWDYDEEFELAISPDEEWTKEVQKLRKRAFELKERIVISPRASIKGGKLLQLGFTKDEVYEMVVFKGVSKEVRQRILAA